MNLRLIRSSSGESFDLPPNVDLIIGRDDSADIVIPDAVVSRRHASVRQEADGIIVTDLGSSLGMSVNGEKCRHGRLVAGDTLTLASIDFRVETTTPTPTPTPTPTNEQTNAQTNAQTNPPAALPPRSAGQTILRPVIRRPEALIVAPPSGGELRAALASSPNDDTRNAQKLEILLGVAKGLTKSTSVDALLPRIADYVFRILNAERCTILLRDDAGALVTRITRDARDARGSEAPHAVPQSIVQSVFTDRVAILTEDAGLDERFTGKSVVMQQVRSAVCAPLITSDDDVVGVLYADSSFRAHIFTESDLDFLVAFASIAAIAIEHERFSERLRDQMLVRSNFERFFTPDLASRIANSADAVKLGGDKRRVAVMFTDIRGFTALSETMTPNDMAQLLTEYFSEMVDCVFRHNGTLDKFIGDAVMAQWGAPIGTENDADSAIATAIDMLNALDVLNERWTREGRPTLGIGIGLTFGEAFAGNIGSERRLEYTVIGDTVNTASRLCSAASAGEILVSDELRLALRHPPEIVAVPPMMLAGKREPVPVFKVVRAPVRNV